MSSIDKIFKDGLDQKGLQYEEANWAAMEQMLETKPGFVARYRYWLLSLLLVGVGAVLFWQLQGTYGKQAQMADKSATELTSQHAAGLISTDNPTTESNSNQTTDEIQPKIKEGVPVGVEPTIPEADKSTNEYEVEPDRKEVTIESSTSFTIHPPEPTGSESGSDIYPPVEGNADFNPASHQPESESGNLAETLTDPVTPESPTEEKNIYDVWQGPLVRIAANESNPFQIISATTNPSKLNVQPEEKSKRLHGFIAPYAFYQTYQMKFGSIDAKERESATSQWGRGLEVGLRLGNWKLGSGVQRTHFVQRTQYTTSQISYLFDTTLSLLNANFGKTPGGSRFALLKEHVDTTTTVVDSECPDCQAEFNYVTVPLYVGYEWGRSRWRYGLDAGIQLMMLRSAKGKYVLQPTNSDEVFGELNSTTLLASNLTQLRGSAFIRYRLTSSLTAWSAYTTSFGLNSMLTSYDQKVNLQQVRLGLEWQW